CGWSDSSVQGLADVLAALPHVVHLRLGIDRFVGTRVGDTLADILVKMQLKSLAISGHCGVLMDCFRRDPSAIPRALAFDSVDMLAWRSFPSLLRQMSGHLELLGVSVHDRRISGDVSDLLSALEKCIMLGRLRLKTSMKSLDDLEDLLSRMHMSHLKEVHCILDLMSDSYQRTTTERIDKITNRTGIIADLFDEHRFSALKVVSFSFITDVHDFERPSMEARISATCAKLRERVTLTLRWTGRGTLQTGLKAQHASDHAVVAIGTEHYFSDAVVNYPRPQLYELLKLLDR
ncbi:hypothetical protein OBBRIDRAFT_808122, partial [Obba rivulosa]